MFAALLDPDPVVSVLSLATKVDTPLILAGLVVLVLFLLFKGNLSPLQSKLVFVLALVAICLGGVAWALPVVLQPSTVTVTVDGRVYSPADNPTAGVPRATVYWFAHGEPPRNAITNEQGYYSLQILNSRGRNLNADMWVIADGFQRSGVQRIDAAKLSESVNFGIQPQVREVIARVPAVLHVVPPPPNANVQAAPAVQPAVAEDHGLEQSPTCLAGTWREHLVGRPDTNQMNSWNFTVDNTGIRAARQDGFVSGVFKKTGVDWRGDLTWGTGEVWHNVLLTPTPDCRLISTNQGWSYGR